MLRELSNVRQTEGARRRRWFESGDEDLIVWYADDGSVHGFQLCYDVQRIEKALTWLPGSGFTHDRVDAGDSRAFRPKGSPMLVADGRFDVAAMTRRFLEISTGLPPEIREFILGKLAEYSRHAHGDEPGVPESPSASKALPASQPQRDALPDWSSFMTVLRAEPFWFRASLLLLIAAELALGGWFGYRAIHESAQYAAYAVVLSICTLGLVRMVHWARRASIVLSWLAALAALGFITPFHVADLMAKGMEPPSTTRLLLTYLPPCAVALWFVHVLTKFKWAFHKSWW